MGVPVSPPHPPPPSWEGVATRVRAFSQHCCQYRAQVMSRDLDTSLTVLTAFYLCFCFGDSFCEFLDGQGK